MKKIPFLKWHLFYITSIVILGYLYYQSRWSDENVDIILEVRNTLRKNFELIDNNNAEMMMHIEREAHETGDTSNKYTIQASKDFHEINITLNENIKGIIDSLITHCGGINPQKTDGRMVETKAFFPFNPFFDDKRINTLKKLIYNYEVNKKVIINKLDTRYYNDLRDFSVVEDSAFWEKLQKSTPAMTLLKLEKLKNKVKLDANITLNYFSKKANWNCWKEDYCGNLAF